MDDSDDRQDTQISDEDIERFASKVEEWGQQLPEEEQRLLKMMLSSAIATAEATDEVQGFDLAVFSNSTPRTFSSATMDALRPISHAFVQPAYNDTW